VSEVDDFGLIGWFNGSGGRSVGHGCFLSAGKIIASGR